jgi:dephospho-CoA kinase
MIKIGITGGIGSGKSTICKIFETLHIPVYYADVEARRLTNTHPNIVKGVKKLFGEDIYINNCLDRKRVGQIVFEDQTLLQQLNEVIHPVVADHFSQWLYENRNAPYVLKEAAILFESGAYKQVDKIITVTSPEELRIKRVMQRDGFSYEEVKSRINNQIDEQERVERADFVIYCNDKDLVVPQVLKVHSQLMNSVLI